MKTEPPITLTLTHDQALVLFDWLSRAGDGQSLPVEHPAEQNVLWAVEGQLENALVEPLQADYRESVSRARERLVSSS